MALPSRRPRSRVLTASAAKYAQIESSAYGRRVSLPWQQRSLEYYETIGEVGYASHFYAKQLSRIKIYPARMDDMGKLTPIETGPPLDLLNRIQDPGGGRSQLQSDYGRLMFITGEGVLFGSEPGGGEERWRFLWLDEVKVDGQVTYRLNAQKQVVEEGTSYRMWRPSPRHSDIADSPLRAVSDVCEELILLTQAVMATASTRMTNGVLLIPQEISFGAAEPIGDEDPENNPFIADFIDHSRGQIENPGAPEAKMPFLIEASYEYLDKIKWFQLHDPQTDYLEKDLRDEAIKRLALGLDFPPEVLLGMTDANHWTAKQVVSDMWRSHGAPVAQQFCNDIAEAYLRPALRDEGFEDWQHITVDFDDADVVIAPDRSADADMAFDRGAINYEGYRILKGIPESMAQSKEEHDEFLAWKLRDPMLLDGQGPQQIPLRGPMPTPQAQPDAQDGPPPPTAGRNGSRREAQTASARVVGAAEMALLRCRELAGARIRSYKNTCPDCLEPANGKPNSLVAALVGPEAVMTLQAPAPLKLVSGGSEAFRGLLNNWGFPDTQAIALSEMIEVYAARTLFETTPAALPSGFAAHVARIQDMTDHLE